MMPTKERADAIGRAQRALKALADHPRSTRTQLGSAREQLNTCYQLGDGPTVWRAVAALEGTAVRVHGVPRLDEQPATAASPDRPQPTPLLSGARDNQPPPRI